MKLTLRLLLMFSTFAAQGQGVVYFVNDTLILTSPPDRLIRFASSDTPGNPFGTNNAPAVGTNFLVQLYYGSTSASEASLTPVSSAPAILRTSTTPMPGLWAGGGDRTLSGVDFGATALLQVRVWNYFDGATYEEALANNPFGLSGKSQPFAFEVPVPPAPPGAYYMVNFQGFSLSVPEPPAACLCLLGFATLLLKASRRNVARCFSSGRRSRRT